MIGALFLFDPQSPGYHENGFINSNQPPLGRCSLTLFTLTFYVLWSVLGFSLWVHFKSDFRDFSRMTMLLWCCLSSVFAIFGCGIMFIAQCTFCCKVPISRNWIH